MGKKRLILILVLLAGVGIFLFRTTSGPREPQYQGKALSAWLKDIRQNQQYSSEYVQATNAVGQIGTNAVPYLISLLQAKDSKLKSDCAFLEWWTGFHFQWAYEKRNAALVGIQVLGPKARGAIPALAQQLSEDSAGTGYMADVIADILSGVGEEAIPVLEAALTNQNQRTRYAAIIALGSFTSRGDVVVPKLIPMLGRGGVIERCAAAITLSRFPEQAEMIVPALMASLEDRNEMMRGDTARALANFCEKAKPAVPLLLKRVETGGTNESAIMAGSLMQIDPEATLSCLIKDMESEDVKVRKAAAQGLKVAKESGSGDVPALVKCLQNKDVAVRVVAAVVLREIGQEPDIVVPALMENLKDSDKRVRMSAAIALGAFGQRSKAAVPTILKIIEESKDDALGQRGLARALRSIDPEAAEKVFPKGAR